jgi:hypothetical protein
MIRRRSPEVILEEIVADNETAQPMIKLYLADTVTLELPPQQWTNGVVDISLSDAPGPSLNHDSIKTTAVFARREEIDVVVLSYLRRTISPYPPRSSSDILATKRPTFSLSLTSMIRSRCRRTNQRAHPEKLRRC